MSAIVLHGSKPAQDILHALRESVATLRPHLVIVQVGNHAASNSYIRQKIRFCKKVALSYDYTQLPETISKVELLAYIRTLNTDPNVSGFFIQVPLPDHLMPFMHEFITAIDPKKDVDGFHPHNTGNTYTGIEYEQLPPATPSGVIQLLSYYSIPVRGKHIVIIGHSAIVGKPLAIMLLNRGATVTICHKDTENLATHTRAADIICTAVGQANILDTTMVSADAIIIDIGFNYTDQGLCGDADFPSLIHHCKAITPVPGGIGLMTVAALIQNVVNAKKLQLASL